MTDDKILRTYIDHEKLKILFEQKLSLYAIHERTEYPITTLQKIKHGQKVDWFISRKSRRSDAAKRHIGKKICTCCQMNPVADGLRFLCDHCFKHAGNDGMDLHGDLSKSFKR